VTSEEKRKELPGIVASQVRMLIQSDPEIREAAIRMTEASAAVDHQFKEVRRYAGYVERVDGEEALMVVTGYDGDELRAVDAKTVRTLAVDGPGAAFVLYELRWSPEMLLSLYVPAVSLKAGKSESELAHREKELLAYETPLPKPKAKTSVAEATAKVSSLAR
jgi:hypothetical protein